MVCARPEPAARVLRGRLDALDLRATEPNAVVAPIHPKAMPVILTKPEQIELWMSAPIGDALALQLPLPDDALHIVARGQKADPRFATG
jgi:putative SOS response-associated peptidase YedK